MRLNVFDILQVKSLEKVTSYLTLTLILHLSDIEEYFKGKNKTFLIVLRNISCLNMFITPTCLVVINRPIL